MRLHSIRTRSLIPLLVSPEYELWRGLTLLYLAMICIVYLAYTRECVCYASGTDDAL